jgi:hypothetical protein
MNNGGLPRVTVLAVVLLGTFAPASSAADAPRSLAKALTDELGRSGSVAVLGSYEGVIALSADGKLRRTLVPGRSFGVRVDNRSEVIWYRADKTGTRSDLMVIDLRKPNVQPQLVVPGIGLTEDPDVAYETPDEVSPPARAQNILLLGEAGPVLQRRVDTCAGKRRRGCPKFVRVPCEPPPKAKRCLQIEASALPLLKELAARAAGRSLFLATEKAPASQPIPMGELACRRCGRASAIPGTPYLAVLTQAEGDFCHVVAQVFDPKTREFIDIDSGRRSPTPFPELGVDFGDAWVSGAGDAFIQQGVLHTFKAGRVLWKGPAEGGGFIGGGRWVPASDYPCD